MPPSPRSKPVLPGVLVMGTGVGVGKTLTAATLALLLRRQGVRVGVFKPIDFACEHRQRQGLVSTDAEVLAHFADSPLDLATICPLRLDRLWYARSGRSALKWQADWPAMWDAYERACRAADVMIVEGYGGVMSPLDAKRTMADLAGELSLDVLLVVPAGPDPVNEALVGLAALHSAGLKAYDVVINRYDPDRAGPADERAAELIAARTKLSLPVVVPPDPVCNLRTGRIGRSVRYPLALWVDKWVARSRSARSRRARKT